MPRFLLFAIVFIEGFCSLGAEVTALRRLVPHMGSAIVVTAPTIGFFLLALALGYHAGGRVTGDFTGVVRRNFLISALLCGVGLAGATVDGLFGLGMPLLMAYLAFLCAVLCPVAYLLGQTVPVLTNLTFHGRVGEASGMALFWSTLGSFLGAATLSVAVMQWFGVSAAVLLTVFLLCFGGLLLGESGWKSRTMSVAILLLAALAAPRSLIGETAYADYKVERVPLSGVNPQGFLVNNSLASALDGGKPATRYIRHIGALLGESLGQEKKEVLVLGAGGFTLSLEAPAYAYTYVDIDPAIRGLAEQHFLKAPATGSFVVDDARHFVATTERRFDALVVDVFSNRMSIPGHLVTAEFWRASRRALAPSGLMVANLILDGRLASPYARNVLATIESVYGPCAVEVLHKGKPVSNVIVSCWMEASQVSPKLYRDEKSSVDLDAAGMN